MIRFSNLILSPYFLEDIVSEENIAIIETGSKQYLVKKGTVLDIEKIETDKESIEFDKVLLVKKGKTTKVGKPYIEGTTIKAKVLNQIKAPKVIVFKFKKKTGYKKKQGHRQNMTTIQIESI
ncbi:50S ribosomal protein L21 [Candidatus Marinamargulisbacteria bacterium SCGC AAA071-K20]|nr:50S ribosomal protein L21 [Candidatus Marinamargulisbacteria bacterium SCGC AAA071-K20]